MNELSEVALLVVGKNEDSVRQTLKNSLVSMLSNGDCDHGSALLILFAPLLDCRCDIVSRLSVGHQIDDRLPVTLPVGCCLDHLAVNFRHQMIECRAQTGAATNGQFRRIKRLELNERRDCPHLSRKCDDR